MIHELWIELTQLAHLNLNSHPENNREKTSVSAKISVSAAHLEKKIVVVIIIIICLLFNKFR